MMIEQILGDALDAPHDQLVVLTPNLRLSRFIHAQYVDYKKHTSCQAWHSLPCFSFGAWSQQLWESFQAASLSPQPLLISSVHETAIWLKIVRGQEGVEVFDVHATAEECRRAWNTLTQWCVDIHSESTISKQYRQWGAHYLQHCDEHNLIDNPTMVSRLITAIERRELALPKRIVLVAFDDLTPQLQKLLAVARDQGVEVVEREFNVRRQTLCRTAAADVDEEILAAARWAALRVARDPVAKVGIVVPDLLPLKKKVERIFTDVFEPQYKMPDSDRHATAFNMSAGVALKETPPIAAAIQLLQLNRSSLSVDDASKILRSPFLGGQDEAHARALFLSEIKQQALEVRFSFLVTKAGEFVSKRYEEDGEEVSVPLLPTFYKSLHEFRQLKVTAPRSQLPSEWGQYFLSQLTALGWPGERALDTLEYQQVDVWINALKDLTRFDYCFGPVTLSQALEFVERLSQGTQFQAQTNESPVQILGTYEAAGLVFDDLWVMNLNNEAWPAPVAPNALLPVGLQRELFMPKASPERELRIATKLLERFRQSATNIVLSYCQADGDKQLEVSSLIEGVPHQPLNALFDPEDTIEGAIHVDYAESLYKFGGVEAFVDSCGPRIEDAKSVRGGSQILKDQAACPFKAFAVHRLGAKSTQEVGFGLSAAERGILIHKTLEVIWRRLRNQAQLLQLSEPQLEKLIAKAIDTSFGEVESRRTIGKRLKQLETERVSGLVHAWLALEKERAPFEVVFNESKKTVTLSKLPIHIRYDRVDKLENGRLFVLDYKTGKVDVRSWTGGRPDEPQIPLYGIANRKKVGGVSYGQINIDQTAIKGIGEDEDIAPGVSCPEYLSRLSLPSDWQGVLDHWREVLENLAREFIAGTADVKPKHPVTSCRHCHLHSLCRIKEYIEVDDEDGEESGDESDSTAEGAR